MEITKDKITEIFCIIAYPELRLLFRGVVILLVKSLTVMW